MSTGASVTIDLAMATRCASPPEKVTSTLTTESRPFGSAAMTVSRFASFAAAMISPSVASLLASRMFSRKGSVSNCGSWNTTDTERCTSRTAMSRRSSPPSSTEPSTGSWKRANSRATVDFPEPEDPTSAVRVPGSNVADIPSRTRGPSA